MYIVITCQYCKNMLSSKDVVVSCNFCRYNPSYLHGQEKSMVMFDAIPIDGEMYSIVYSFKTRETEVLFLRTIETGGYVKWETFTKLIAPLTITPDNVEEFVRRCVRMKAFV